MTMSLYSLGNHEPQPPLNQPYTFYCISFSYFLIIIFITGVIILEIILYRPFHVLIIIWNSKTFELTKLKRFIFVILNFILVYGALFLIAFKSGGF